jgi:hypothetical protein
VRQSDVTVLKASAVRAPRPPKSVWTVDLKLSNGDTKPKWFVFSDPLENPPASRTSPGVKLLESNTTKPAGGTVRLLRFSSTPNVLAVCVAPGATVLLSEVKLQCWIASGVEALEVHATSALLVSGQSVTEGWLKGHSVVSPEGEVHAVFGAGRQLLNHLNPNFEAEPLSYDVEEAWKCALNVTAPWPPETPEEISAISSIVQLNTMNGGPKR